MAMNTLKSFNFNENRTFGVEIEFNGISSETAIQAIRTAGITIYKEGYNHSTRPHWKLVTDASVNNRGTGLARGGWEVVSPKLTGKQGLVELATVMKALDQAGAKVDRSCGLHVHHDVTDYQVKDFQNIYYIYYKFENYFDSVVPASRRGSHNIYCKGINKEIIESVEKARTINDLRHSLPDRYLKLNFQSYFRHETIEFRQHSGTVDADKATNWVMFTQSIVERAKLETIRLAKKDHDRDAVTNFNHERRLRRTLFGEVTRESLENEYGQAIKFQIKRRQHFESQAA
ncbi:putative cytoplasmic protein [Desulfofarcimen acetoxidans DSM 771]|uniref:Putative cytoplasmic protein n=1 Tax=Desulfofarcimen acetoxidans (strain ATCC 49208 / DSM 771 / KCTC 5769 / VKM B-1644 / 5575) TaxID=485916 RepID=C8VXX7_DESAS|nr:amidoligase family protein [Desulfofarcimen acetoxidans]ACV64606.1 putative cytoplasmic protein [Desulfofarcimen acetoxidans DSM 771]